MFEPFRVQKALDLCRVRGWGGSSYDGFYVGKRAVAVGVGDELMATGDASKLYAKTGKKVLIADMFGRPRYHDLFRGNPKIWHPKEWKGRVAEHPIVISGPGRRPYADYDAIQDLGERHAPGETDRKKLRRAAGRLIFAKDYKATAGEVTFDKNETQFGERIAKQLGDFFLIEIRVKGRVPTKQWGVQNWQALADLMRRNGLTPVQLGGSRSGLHGVQHINTPTFRQAMAVMQYARGFVFPEGGAHHAMGALHKKGVALFAGRTPLGLSYPEQLTWYKHDKHSPCGMEHNDCPHCRRHWNALTPSHVFEMLKHQCG